MTYLLDTNHLSPLVTIGHPLRNMVYQHLLTGDSFALTAVVLSEFLFGIGSLPRAKQNLHEWQQLQPFLTIYDVNSQIAEEAAKLRLHLQRRGWQLGAIDAIVAVVALQDNLTLLTEDKDFSAVANLLQENWL